MFSCPPQPRRRPVTRPPSCPCPAARARGWLPVARGTRAGCGEAPGGRTWKGAAWKGLCISYTRRARGPGQAARRVLAPPVPGHAAHASGGPEATPNHTAYRMGACAHKWVYPD